MKRRIDLAIAILVFLALNLILARFQEPLVYQPDVALDGVYYIKMTEDFQNKQRPATVAPFVFRIGAPYLAALYGRGTGIIAAWLDLGLIANAASLLLLYVFLCLHFEKPWLRLTLLLLFIIPFHSVVRRLWFSPVSTDPWDKPFLLMGLIVMHRVRAAGWRVSLAASLAAVTFVGVLFREIVMVLPLAALCVTNPIWLDAGTWRVRKIALPPAIAALPMLAGLGALTFVKGVVAPTDEAHVLRTSLYWIHNKTVTDYALAWFIAFSPMVVLPVYYWRQSVQFLLRNQYLLVYLAAFAMLAWIGGAATFRFVSWAMPVVFVLIGLAIDRCAAVLRKAWWLTAILAASYILSQRVFWLWPNYPGGVSTPWVFLTPLAVNAPVPDIVGMGSTYIRLATLASYLIVSGAVLMMLRKLESSGPVLETAKEVVATVDSERR